MYIDKILPNGVRVVAKKLPNFRSCSIGVWVKAGCAGETSSINGISHFIEHMLFKGTEKRTAKQIAMDMDNIGGQINAFTSKEFTCYYSKVMDSKLRFGMEIVGDIFCNSVFDEDEIRKEKGVVIEEISMSEDQPDDVALERLASTFFEGTTIGQTILGPAENIRGLTRERMLEYMQGLYQPDNYAVSVAGNFDENELYECVQNYFSRPQNAPSKPPAVYVDNEKKQKFTWVNKEIEQVHLALALPGHKYSDVRKDAVAAVSNILGGSMSSRLFQRIREQMGMAYSVFTFPSSYEGSGMLAAYAACSADNAKVVLEAMVEEFEKMKREGITQEELSQSKEQLMGNFVLSQESSSTRMNLLGKSALLRGHIVTEEEVIERTTRLTLDDLHAAVEHSFDFDKVSIVAVGKNTDSLKGVIC